MPRGERVCALLPYRGRFLTLTGAEIVKLGPTGFPGLLDFHLRDPRGVKGKHPLDTLAIGNAANRESLIQAAAFPTDYDPAEDLDSLLIPFHDAGVNTHAVTDRKRGSIGLLLFLFDEVDNAVHKVWKRLSATYQK